MLSGARLAYADSAAALRRYRGSPVAEPESDRAIVRNALAGDYNRFGKAMCWPFALAEWGIYRLAVICNPPPAAIHSAAVTPSASKISKGTRTPGSCHAWCGDRLRQQPGEPRIQ